MQVADPFVARVLDPVVPAGDKVNVSEVMAIVTFAAAMLMNVMAVPIGYATELFAGIVNVRALLSAAGWKMCLPASAATSVYAALWLFCGILRNGTSLTAQSTLKPGTRSLVMLALPMVTSLLTVADDAAAL